MSLLQTTDLTMTFGGVTAVNKLNLDIEKGQIVSIIGPNGAGKTTCYNMITGVYEPTEGKILFNGQDITGMRPDKIAKLGIARTFQNIRLFKDLTVFQNVIIGMHLRLKANVFTSTFRIPKISPYVKEEREMKERTFHLLERVNLLDLKDHKANSLPYGAQRRLEIARALATSPELLLLDEPAAGMNPNELNEMTDFIKSIKEDFDLTVLIIEHHMDLVMQISEKIYVMDFGINISTGTPKEVREDERVVAAYLGVEENA